jgi:hypothetical protein
MWAYQYKSKRLRSNRRSSPCIFQVVVSLSILSFRTYLSRIFSCFQSISVYIYHSVCIQFSTRNSEYFVCILQQLPSMRTTHVGNQTRINKGMSTHNLRTGMLWEIKSRIESHYIISLELVCRREHDRFWVMFLLQVRILMLLILAI